MATKWGSLDKLRYAISKIHTLLQGKVDKVDGKGLSANDLTAALKGNYDAAYTHSQAAHAPAAAEKNIIVGVQVNGADLTPSAARKVNVSVPTGALAGKSQVSETDLDDTLKEKVNSASEGNHSHNNKAVLDQIEQTDLDKLDGIAAGANKYVHPTSSGSKHIPTGGASGQILRWSADGTAVWGADNDTKYSPATQSANGLMSAADKTKLDGFGAASSYALKSDITQMYRYKGSVADASKLPASGQVAGDVYDIQAASSYGPAGTNVAWNGTAWDALGGAFTIEECTNAEIDQIFTDLAAG